MHLSKFHAASSAAHSAGHGPHPRTTEQSVAIALARRMRGMQGPLQYLSAKLGQPGIRAGYNPLRPGKCVAAHSPALDSPGPAQPQIDGSGSANSGPFDFTSALEATGCLDEGTPIQSTSIQWARPPPTLRLATDSPACAFCEVLSLHRSRAARSRIGARCTAQDQGRWCRMTWRPDPAHIAPVWRSYLVMTLAGRRPSP